jgi:sugar lactone lactonase YvrE
MTVVLGPAVLSVESTVTLGEGSRWHSSTGELLWVDITGGMLFREFVDDAGHLTRVATHEASMPVGAVAPVAAIGGWVLAAGRGFAYLPEDGPLRVVAETDAVAGARMNDGACDRRGRFWAGAVAHDLAPGASSLYRLDGDGSVSPVLRGLTISNGIGWSPDGSTMYLADSGPGCVFAFDFDEPAGELSSRRVLIELDAGEGVPDGLTVDDQGCLWVAVYGGSEVRRYSPSGALLERVPVPARQVTSCCFGGPLGTTLFITTARERFGEDESREQPLAGSVFAVPTTMTAPAVAEFEPALELRRTLSAA